MSNPTTSRRDGEATRQRLLRAALDLYTTIGFRATTTPAIAARAGVAEGTIYRHFSGKEHLLNEVYRNAQHWGAGLVEETEPNGHHAVSERLAGIARRLLEVADRDPSLTRMLLRSRDEQHLDERSREAARQFRQALQQVVGGGERRRRSERTHGALDRRVAGAGGVRRGTGRGAGVAVREPADRPHPRRGLGRYRGSVAPGNTVSWRGRGGTPLHATTRGWPGPTGRTTSRPPVR